MCKSCSNCYYARKTTVPDSVACAYVFSEHQMDYQKTMIELDLETVNVGWGYMKCRPEMESDTLDKSLITNEVVVFKKNFVCKQYEGYIII